MSHTTNRSAAMPAQPLAPRHRSSRKWGQRLLGAVFALLIVALVLGVLRALWTGYTVQTVTGTVFGFTVTSDTNVDIRIDVVKRPGSRAYCIVRSRGADGAEVGRDVLTVDALGTVARRARGEIKLQTTARAVTGEVQGCSDTPIDKDPEHVQDANHP